MDHNAVAWASALSNSNSNSSAPVPTLSVPAAMHHTSSVSSPSAADSDCAADVDDLLDGIDRARIDHLWPSTTTCTSTKPTNITTNNNGQNDYVSLFSSQGPFAATPCISPNPTASSTTSLYFAHHQHIQVPALHAGHFAAAISSASSSSTDLPSSPDSTLSSTSTSTSTCHTQHLDMPRMFKVLPCPHRARCEASGDTAECFYYHDASTDRRRVDVSAYKPHMCRFVDEHAGGCRKGERCPFAHNDFERRYHPDRFGKETCRDFLRGDCPRRFCTFKHHVSRKVQVAIEQVDAMADKEMLQFVLKMSDEKGRALCDKLLRRFGHGKKHSGWRIEGFNGGKEKECAHVKGIAARVDAVKKRLKTAGEKKWAASLKTTSLRDMMSGVRKVAEEMRERCRAGMGTEEVRHDEQGNQNGGGGEAHRLIRAVFSNTNWSCHSQDGDNPFLVTPENQNDAVSALEKLVDCLVNEGQMQMPALHQGNAPVVNANDNSYAHHHVDHNVAHNLTQHGHQQEMGKKSQAQVHHNHHEQQHIHMNYMTATRTRTKNINVGASNQKQNQKQKQNQNHNHCNMKTWADSVAHDQQRWDVGATNTSTTTTVAR